MRPNKNNIAFAHSLFFISVLKMIYRITHLLARSATLKLTPFRLSSGVSFRVVLQGRVLRPIIETPELMKKYVADAIKSPESRPNEPFSAMNAFAIQISVTHNGEEIKLDF